MKNGAKDLQTTGYNGARTADSLGTLDTIMHNKTFNVINNKNLIVNVKKRGKILHCAKQGRIRYWLTATDAWNSQYQKHQSVVVLKASKASK